jgi:hypothetical protein
MYVGHELSKTGIIKMYVTPLMVTLDHGLMKKVKELQIVKIFQMPVFIQDCISKLCPDKKLRKGKTITHFPQKNDSMSVIYIQLKVNQNISGKRVSHYMLPTAQLSTME